MLYRDFIEAGITLEEIGLIQNYAQVHNLELSEDREDLCLINSDTEEVVYRGLDEITGYIKDAYEEMLSIYIELDSYIRMNDVTDSIFSKSKQHNKVA